MDGAQRWENYKYHDLDQIMMMIRSGQIKCGRYANKLKLGDPPEQVKGWWLDGNGKSESGKRSEDSGHDRSRTRKKKKAKIRGRGNPEHTE